MAVGNLKNMTEGLTDSTSLKKEEVACYGQPLPENLKTNYLIISFCISSPDFNIYIPVVRSETSIMVPF